MSEQAYFFDTYAFFEIIRGNPAYEKYKDSGAMTTIFNLAELNYGLKKETSKEKADKITDKYFAGDYHSVVQDFLANATTWRGNVARRVKTELNLMLENYYV